MVLYIDKASAETRLLGPPRIGPRPVGVRRRHAPRGRQSKNRRDGRARRRRSLGGVTVLRLGGIYIVAWFIYSIMVYK